MPTKSLVEICQSVIGKHLDALYDLGDTPYRLLKEPLKRASAQQLYRIEKCNPHILEDTMDLWISHCLSFRDIRLSYESGHIPPDNNWRETYLERHEENQRKRQLIGAKIKSHYNQIQNDKEARSTKFLNKAIAPTKRRPEHNSNWNAKRSRGNSLFAKTMIAAKQEAAIYHCHDSRRSNFTKSSHSLHTNTTIIRIEKSPSALQKSYSSQPLKEPLQIKPPVLLKPSPILATPSKPAFHSSIPAKHPHTHTKYQDPPPSLPSKGESLSKWSTAKVDTGKLDDNTKHKQSKAAKDSAIVNFGIFKELSGH